MQTPLTRTHHNVLARDHRMLLAVILLLICCEPALANKFETIGGGVSGSYGLKSEQLKIFLLVAGGISLLGAILSIIIPHKNPLFLNYSNWKQSAIVLFVFAAVFFGIAAII